MAAKVYPEWVQQYRRKGTTIKKVGDHYYLYKHTSKREPGRKNPVPVDTYIGKITPQGIEEKGYRKIRTKDDEVIVKEYGFSRTAEILCPDDWKKIQGNKWQEIFDYIIRMQSPETYISEIRKIPDTLGEHVQPGVLAGNLSRRMYKACGKGLEDLKGLTTIYLVTIGKTRMISRISEEQEAILDQLDIRLEV